MVILLMDAITEVTGEKEREFLFSPFLTKGLNQKRRILQKDSFSIFGQDGQ